MTFESSCLQRPATPVHTSSDPIDLFVLFVSRAVSHVSGGLKPDLSSEAPNKRHLGGKKPKKKKNDNRNNWASLRVAIISLLVATEMM